MDHLHVTSSSQPHRLAEELTAAGVGHGDRIVADLVGVQVRRGSSLAIQQSPRDQGTPTLYFCNMRGIENIRRIERGDGTHISSQDARALFVNTFIAPADGTVNLRGVEIYADGKIELTRTEETRFEPVTRELTPA